MYGATMSPSSSSKRRPIGLAALRGFESAARRLSFTDAAAELNLTQSSISRQIATLERQVGKALFVRKTRALLLTPAGAQPTPSGPRPAPTPSWPRTSSRPGSPAPAPSPCSTPSRTDLTECR